MKTDEKPTLRCSRHPLARLDVAGSCRACVRLGYEVEIGSHKIGLKYVQTIRFTSKEEIAQREPCCGEDLGTHADWCAAHPTPTPEPPQ